jgi:hypothetical protein
MADNPLFYRTVVPLDRERHGKTGLTVPERPFGLAEGSHFIPAVVDEFAAACRELPIVFLAGSPHPTAVFLVGLRPGRNLFVKPDGSWDGTYVPAYLRRYPFIRGDIEGADPVVCIDESFEGFEDGKGESLFADGGESPFLAERIQFLNGYFEAAKRTEALGQLVQELSLLKGISIDVKAEDGSSTVLHGIFAIDEAKLATLSDEDYLRLRSAGAIAPIYAHLLSLGAIERIGAKAGVVSQ